MNRPSTLGGRRQSIRIMALVPLFLSCGGVFALDEPTRSEAPRSKPPGASTSRPGFEATGGSSKTTPPAAAKSSPAAESRAPASTKREGPAGDEPKVLSADPSRRRSEFLSPDGSTMDRYDSTDWATIPPWRQTSFFGIRAQGRVFVYVVDCSGSMADAERLTRAKIELRRAIGSLQFPQRFHVIFYNDEALPMPGGLPRSPDTRAKTQLNTWLAQIEAEGGTDPRGALKTALALQPDAVFLLSDGALPEKSAAEVAAGNRRRTPIHCIDLSSGSGGDQLRKIAADSGGRYVRRP